MKSLFKLAFSCALLPMFATAATAKPYQSNETIEADFAAIQSKNYSSASLRFDQENNQIELSLQPAMPACKKGFFCAQFLPAPETYVLSDARSSIDSCGIIRTTAVDDQMPVDGIKTQLILTNNSGNTCPTLVALPVLKLVVKKQWYSRLETQKVTTRDTFEADDFSVSQAPVVYQAVIRADLQAHSTERYLGASIFADGRKGLIDLTLQPVMPACKEGFACAQVMPEAIVYNLENAKTEIDGCGIIRTVASFDQRPVDGIYLKVTMINNRNSTCPTFAPLAALDVIVEQEYNSFRRLVHTLDSFSADDFAMIKPSNK